MRFFVCLIDSDGYDISYATRRAYESLPRSRGLECTWQLVGQVAALTAWDDPHGDSLVATSGAQVAVGVVRLDNRKEIAQWAGIREHGLTDLELVLRTVTLHGARYIPQLLGDFAFVVWTGDTRTALAATDALGVRKLFYAEPNGLLAFSSRAEALALDERYDAQYLTELIAQFTPSEGLTAYAGVRRLHSGMIATLQPRGLALRRYWSPDEFEPEPLRAEVERDAPEFCRQLLAESVQRHLDDNGNTWAQLSGGLDSSSIVSMAQWLAERGAIAHGLSGTVSFVDWQDTDADEREYSNAVADHWHVRNETIVDPPFWFEDGEALPRLDQPGPSIASSPRDRRLCAMVRSAGGRVLLTGFGGDELFTGTTLFFADWLAGGRVWTAIREMARWSAIGRVSFWDLAYGNAILPLVPTALRNPGSFGQGRLLPWIAPAAVQRYGLRSRAACVTGNQGRIGRKYHEMNVRTMTAFATQLNAGAIGDTLDVRYPFLSRPLVEFALRLPPALCARPRARKWVLREAMRGILPELVRTRVGKGGPTDVLVRSLIVQRPVLEPLLHDSILADLGVIDVDQLRAAFETAPLAANAKYDLCTDVQTTLMVEAWLRLRSGRWPQGAS